MITRSCLAGVVVPPSFARPTQNCSSFHSGRGQFSSVTAGPKANQHLPDPSLPPPAKDLALFSSLPRHPHERRGGRRGATNNLSGAIIRRAESLKLELANQLSFRHHSSGETISEVVAATATMVCAKKEAMNGCGSERGWWKKMVCVRTHI